jgi:hypothetical protein
MNNSNGTYSLQTVAGITALVFTGWQTRTRVLGRKTQNIVDSGNCQVYNFENLR